MRIMYPDNGILGTITLGNFPYHYALVAGYVKVVTGREKPVKDGCGNIDHYEQVITRDWISNGYNLVLEENDQGQQIIENQGPRGPKPDYATIPYRAGYGMDWDQDTSNFAKPGQVWQPMGPILPGVTYQAAIRYLDQYCATNPVYGKYSNNCYRFANNLYKFFSEGGTPGIG